jgi:hydrogenase expression/formation protein HypE
MNDVATRDRIELKHGAGGRAMRALIQQVFLAQIVPLPGTVGAAAMDDGAAMPVGDEWLVVTTDAHVVHPVFFPGGDIGRLAVAGTVNDLAVMGATDVLGLACAVVIEEGFPQADLARIQASIHTACREADASIVTGDTKVMGRGEIDGIVMTTTGFGLTKRVVRDNGLMPGDLVIVTGTVGDHGLAIMAARHDLALDGPLVSDTAPLNSLVRLALEAGGAGVTAMKDPTRGGLASALHEMADKSGVGMLLREVQVPVAPAVRAAGELLGIDPLHVANEGKAVIGVRPEAIDRVLRAIRSHPLGRHAAVIAECVADRPGMIVVDTGLGHRLLVEPDGEPMPRIC